MSNIIVLSTGDINGAYEAAYRITRFASEAGHNAALIVKSKTRHDRFIFQTKTVAAERSFARRVAKRLFGRFFSQPPKTPTTDPKYLFLEEDERKTFVSSESILKTFPFRPDLIVVGMTNGFVTTTNLQELAENTGAPLALITTDMFPLTGGCHYAWDCTGYERDCADCPAVTDRSLADWPKVNLEIKLRNLANIKTDILSMSGWSDLQVRRSSLFHQRGTIYRINSCIDTQVFNPSNRPAAKSLFGLPVNAKVIFIGSQNIQDERKGVIYILEALKVAFEIMDPEFRDKTIVILIGRDINSVSEISSKILFKTRFLEYITDYRLLSLLYSAADVFVCGSIEDTGPMMVSEALSCGTPVVGFDTGIVYNMIENGKNGFKVPVRDATGMGHGIAKVLSASEEEFSAFSGFASDKVLKESSSKNVVDALEKLISVK